MLRTLTLVQIPAARPRFPSFRPASTVMTAFAAIVEALSASRQYQELRTRGLSHDGAIRETFGTGPNLLFESCIVAHGCSTRALRGWRTEL
jgi:hypothetical protein